MRASYALAFLHILTAARAQGTTPDCNQFIAYEGYYYDYVKCRPCTVCPPEGGVFKPCDQFSDTICTPQICTTVQDCTYTGCHDSKDKVIQSWGCNCATDQYFEYYFHSSRTTCRDYQISQQTYCMQQSYVQSQFDTFRWCLRKNFTTVPVIPKNALEGFAVVLDRGGSVAIPTYIRCTLVHRRLIRASAVQTFEHHGQSPPHSGAPQ
jgi:hypothetical protein